MLINIATKESDKLGKQISWIKSKVNNQQIYTLSCNSNKNTYRWRCNSIKGKDSYYLKKTDIDVAKKLAKDTYYKYLLEDLLAEKKAIDYYINHHALVGGKSEKYLQNPEVCKLLSANFKIENEDLLQWENDENKTPSIHPEGLTVRSASGRMVRSKSEAIIDTALMLYKIPHRYEDEIIIRGIALRPDFIIRHPKTGEYYIWEHLGMMDDKKYLNNACAKIKIYAEAGYYPNVNLIITSETANNPVDLQLINAIIEHYFCE